jgi:hypothetical protein
MYLVKDDEKEKRVRDPGRPRKNIRPSCQENGDQSEHGSDELDVADVVTEGCKENFLYIEEHGQTGKIGHIFIRKNKGEEIHAISSPS